MRSYIRLSHSRSDETICDNLDCEIPVRSTFTVLQDGYSIGFKAEAFMLAVADACESASGFALIGVLTR